jgi:multidrug efflux pump subunit AcrA (membrane-fusion protein)
VAELELLRQNLVLHAPVSGQVTQILCRPGQAVVSGEPVVMVTAPLAQEVVAYVNEEAFGQIKPNMPVLLAPMANPTQTGRSAVVRIGPAVEQMPQRLWRSAQAPEFGRPVMIAVQPGMGIIPGESIRVEFQTPHTARIRPMLAFLLPRDH